MRWQQLWRPSICLLAHPRICELSQRTFPCTTACSPKTITFPGAETMKAGIIGDDCLRLNCERGLEAGFSPPLICTRFTPLLSSSSWEGILDVGDNNGVLQAGVVIMWLMELDREELRSGRGARKSSKVLLVISQHTVGAVVWEIEG